MSKANSERNKLPLRIVRTMGFRPVEVCSYVLEKPKEGWSPEQTSDRPQKEKGGKVISHETTYRFVYSSEDKDKRLWATPRKTGRYSLRGQ